MGFLEDLHTQEEWVGTETCLDRDAYASTTGFTARRMPIVEKPNFIEDYEPPEAAPAVLMLPRVTGTRVVALVIAEVAAPVSQSSVPQSS